MAQVFLRDSLLGTLVVLRTRSYVSRSRRPDSCKEVASPDMHICIYIYTHSHPHPYMRNYSSGDMFARACSHTSYAWYRNKQSMRSPWKTLEKLLRNRWESSEKPVRILWETCEKALRNLWGNRTSSYHHHIISKYHHHHIFRFIIIYQEHHVRSYVIMYHRTSSYIR